MYLEQIDALMDDEIVLEAGELDGDDGSDTAADRNEVHIFIPQIPLYSISYTAIFICIPY